jgi:hypothetical protein
MQSTMSIITVPKETLGQKSFSNQEVLADGQARSLRMAHLQRALILGNAYHHKVRIVYQLRNGGHEQVETTVWEADSDHISLKGGNTIPVRSIMAIEF